MALATESDSRNFKKLDCSSRSEALVVRLSDRTAGQVGFAREIAQESTFGRIESDPTGLPAREMDGPPAVPEGSGPIPEVLQHTPCWESRAVSRAEAKLEKSKVESRKTES